MYNIGWKENDFKSDDVSILGHSCGVSQFIQLYEKINTHFYHVHMWEVIRVKKVTNFSGNMYSCIRKISLNIYESVNK